MSNAEYAADKVQGFPPVSAVIDWLQGHWTTVLMLAGFTWLAYLVFRADPKDGADAAHLNDLAEWATHHLQNADILAPQSIDVLRPFEKDWRESALRAMESAGCSSGDISRFRVLGTYPQRFHTAVSDEHLRFRNMIAERIHRLRRAAQRLEDRTQ